MKRKERNKILSVYNIYQNVLSDYMEKREIISEFLKTEFKYESQLILPFFEEKSNLEKIIHNAKIMNVIKEMVDEEYVLKFAFDTIELMKKYTDVTNTTYNEFLETYERNSIFGKLKIKEGLMPMLIEFYMCVYYNKLSVNS